LRLCVALIRAGVDKRGVTVVLRLLLGDRLGRGGSHSAAARIRRRLVARILVLREGGCAGGGRRQSYHSG